MTSETANTAGILRNRRISFLHSCRRLMMLLNVGGQISTIQLIIYVIPIDEIDRSDRLKRMAVPGWFGNTRGIRACTAVPILSAGEPSLDQPTEPIGFTFFIC
jgi:hypothetical protein